MDIEPSDVAATKLIATAHSRLLRRLGRTTNDRGTKDIDTILALVADSYVDLETVDQRIATIEMEPALIAEAAGVMRELRLHAISRS